MKINKSRLQEMAQEEIQSILNEQPRTLAPAKADIRVDDPEAERVPYPGAEPSPPPVTRLPRRGPESEVPVTHWQGMPQRRRDPEGREGRFIDVSNQPAIPESLQRIIQEELQTLLAEERAKGLSIGDEDLQFAQMAQYKLDNAIKAYNYWGDRDPQSKEFENADAAVDQFRSEVRDLGVNPGSVTGVREPLPWYSEYPDLAQHPMQGPTVIHDKEDYDRYGLDKDEYDEWDWDGS